MLSPHSVSQFWFLHWKKGVIMPIIYNNHKQNICANWHQEKVRQTSQTPLAPQHESNLYSFQRWGECKRLPWRAVKGLRFWQKLAGRVWEWAYTDSRSVKDPHTPLSIAHDVCPCSMSRPHIDATLGMHFPGPSFSQPCFIVLVQ